MSSPSQALVDVLVLGAGPAGAIAALNLAPTLHVALVEPRAAPPLRIGESLPPAARRLLTLMGLWEAFVAEHHAPCHGNLSRWGSDALSETDFLRDLDGHGWHLDRARFESWLRGLAVVRGAELLCPATPRTVTRQGGRWCITVERPAHHGAITTTAVELHARALIDATGRGSWLGRRLGAHRHLDDRLVCSWTRLPDPRRSAQLTHIVAEPDGWWYSAPLPGGARVLAFHTDSDLDAASDARDRARLVARARRTAGVVEVLGGLLEQEPRPSAEAQPGLPGDGAEEPPHALVAACGSVLTPAADDGWLATGDAALTFDPLSSQGLLNSLFTGLAAAEATSRALEGHSDALPGYLEMLAGIRSAYLAHVSRWYGEERRFADRPFWKRRHG